MPELPPSAPPSPVTPIGELKSWRLVVRCRLCRNSSTLPLDYLAEQYGARLPVHRAVERLRCRRERAGQRCGGVPGHVVLAEFFVYGKSARKAREIVVREG